MALKDFGTHTTKWEFLEKISEEYATFVMEPSCALLKVNDKLKPVVFITKKTDNTFYVANITPLETMAEYNSVAKQFATDLKEYARNYKQKIKVKTTQENIGLAEIISGIKTREMFEKYLNMHPTSYHPLDIKRLDTFICAVFRYSRIDIELHLLKRLLLEDKKWSEKDASWCIERIETGLSVLKVNKMF